MGIEVRTCHDTDRWNDLVGRAAAATPFHLDEALAIIAEHGSTRLDRLVGYKGDEPVGLFPVFTRSMGTLTATFSPPPSLKVSYLGPVSLDPPNVKTRRRELRNTRFIEGCLEWLAHEHRPQYFSLYTSPRYDDVRPFIWQDYDTVPQHTYVVDLSRGEQALLDAMSTDARRNVTKPYDADYAIHEGGLADIEDVVEQVARRHREQGVGFPVDPSFVVDLYETLPPGVVRPYVCTIDGAFAGGTINLEFGDRSITWLGGAKTSHDIPVNDLLDWTYCRDAIDRGVVAYDLAGANNKRISQYKAKFAPSLQLFYRVEKKTMIANAAAKIYSKIA